MNKKVESNHTGYLLRQASHLSQQLYNEKLESKGISFSKYRVLSLHYENNSDNQSELQKDLFIKTSSLTKLIDVLEQKGLVKRVSDKMDGRIKKIILTKTGDQLETELWDIKEVVEAKITKFLTEEDKTLLNKQLNLIKKSLLDKDNCFLCISNKII